MIVILAVLAGAVSGALIARSRGGRGLDMAQYAAGYAIAFGILGLLVTVLVHRAAL
ncbi:hypothetical protein [Pukyongiella litopenaei]|uniref:hypothetical protein n=1 Tax=Pukyongiella litopenaei TaxID=2605946 RepID=UPI001B80CB15|nr:hypothetical protein [Pukyongiella litopenaei]